MKLRSALLLAFLASPGTAAVAAVPSANTEVEIAHLLTYLETSRCDFYRNGSWHDPKEARAHLEKKKNYLMKRALLRTAEDFVDMAATASSVSGERYQVRCAPSPAVPSSDWLRAELARIRASGAQ